MVVAAGSGGTVGYGVLTAAAAVIVVTSIAANECE